MEEDRFKYWYKKKIEESEELPPESVWENIQDQLDIDNTWEHIAGELHREEKVVFFHRLSYSVAAAAAVLILLLFVFPPRISQNTQKSYTEKIENKNTIRQIQRTSPLYSSVEKTIEDNLTNTEIARFETGGLKRHIKHTLQTTNESQEQDYQLDMHKLKSLEAKLSVEDNKYAVLAQSNAPSSPSSEKEEDDTKEKPKIYIGTSGQFTNTWLLSNKTLNSIKNSPYSAAEPQRNNSFSLIGGIELNDRLSFQVEGLLNNSNGQNYKEYLNGKFITNQINLNYSSIQLAGRYKFIKEGKNIPVSHNLVFGTYGSYLQNANQHINDEQQNIRASYKNYDFGLLVGYEIDSRISQNLIFSSGVRLDPGLINIYSGSEELPSEFNKTYTTSLSLQLSLKYVLE
ncbi:MAG: hypothetical protein R6U04_05510 [Bacteroidales bacterium]